VWCQVEVSATGHSLQQRSRTECGVSECDLETSTKKRLKPTTGCWTMKKKPIVHYKHQFYIFI
jgi:hypothetical protein